MAAPKAGFRKGLTVGAPSNKGRANTTAPTSPSRTRISCSTTVLETGSTPSCLTASTLASWAAGLDASNPFHVGNTGGFDYFAYLWDGLINAEE